MNVLHIGKFYPILGGVERVMFDLCEGLSQRQIHADMLCASSDNHNHTIRINDRFSIYCTSSLMKAPFAASC